jgi:hypothetical protein
MTKPLTIKDINALRVLVNKMAKPPAQTPEQRKAKQNAKAAKFRADSLAWAQQHWDAEDARLTAKYSAYGALALLGMRPTTHTHKIQDRYREHLNKQPTEKA